MSELKPCPFCGATPKIQQDFRYPRPSCQKRIAWEVVCPNYKCIIGNVDNNYYLSKAEAIEAWNRRVKDE